MVVYCGGGPRDRRRLHRVFLRELAFAKVHFGVLLHELLQHVLLLLLVRGGQTHLLLALVVHHLLNQAARLAVQIR